MINIIILLLFFISSNTDCVLCWLTNKTNIVLLWYRGEKNRWGENILTAVQYVHRLLEKKIHPDNSC